jgi:hypothetical protein
MDKLQNEWCVIPDFSRKVREGYAKFRKVLLGCVHIRDAEVLPPPAAPRKVEILP